MREMVTFFDEELSRNEELLSSERKAARSILNLFVEGTFSYLAVDHADIDEDDFALKCISEFRVKVGDEWEGIVAKIAKARPVMVVDSEEEEVESEKEEVESEGDMEAPQMEDSDNGDK